MRKWPARPPSSCVAASSSGSAPAEPGLAHLLRRVNCGICAARSDGSSGACSRGSRCPGTKAKGTPQQSVIGFAGRVSRIARVHQYGFRDRAERRAPKVRYVRRELLSLPDEELKDLGNSILNCLSSYQAWTQPIPPSQLEL